jgi:hypothetical protein
MKTYTEDDIMYIAIAIVNRLIQAGLVEDSTDTDDENEFILQGIIIEELIHQLNW